MKLSGKTPETVEELWLTVAPILDSLWRNFTDLRDRLDRLERNPMALGPFAGSADDGPPF